MMTSPLRNVIKLDTAVSFLSHQWNFIYPFSNEKETLLFLTHVRRTAFPFVLAFPDVFL